MSRGYDVGYGKPPRASQFKRGNKEHLKRKTSPPSADAKIFSDIMSESIPVRKGTRTIYKSRMQVVMENLFTAALNGDVAAAESILSLYVQFEKRNQMTPTLITFPDFFRKVL